MDDDATDRKVSFRLDMTTDATELAKLSQRDYAYLTKAVLLETVRKLDTYLVYYGHASVVAISVNN